VGVENDRRFVHDSPPEGDGFEPSVPRSNDHAFRDCCETWHLKGVFRRGSSAPTNLCCYGRLESSADEFATRFFPTVHTSWQLTCTPLRELAAAA
jgi:hypothetical protein